MKNILSAFKKVATNSHPARNIDRDGPMRYRRDDLSQWAKEAFDRGEYLFYTKPVDPNNPYGKLELSEPEYEYQLKRGLTLEEMEYIKSALEYYNNRN